jgi:hypothetical protein
LQQGQVFNSGVCFFSLFSISREGCFQLLPAGKVEPSGFVFVRVFHGCFLAPQDAVRAYFTVFGRFFVGGGGMLFGCRPFLENGYVRDSGDGYTSSPVSYEKAFAFL